MDCNLNILTKVQGLGRNDNEYMSTKQQPVQAAWIMLLQNTTLKQVQPSLKFGRTEVNLVNHQCFVKLRVEWKEVPT